MREHDVRDLACPGPVLKLRDLLAAGEREVRFWVADELCRSNVTRFATSRGAAVEVEEHGDGTCHVTVRAGEDAPLACNLPQSSATLWLNAVLASRLQPGDRVVISALEHNAVMRPLRQLESARGLTVRVVAGADAGGVPTAVEVAAAVAEAPTALVVVSHASNVTGAVLPVSAIAAAVAPLPVVVDGAQTAGALPFDFQSSGLAGFACSGHKGLLATILCGLPRLTSDDLIVGVETADDAGVVRLTPELAIIHTADFFPPMVDDPYAFGRIAATNALSDVWAMGGRPLAGMNLVSFPLARYDKATLQEILRGGLEALRDAGAVLAGGHTIEGQELLYGLAVTGTVHPDRVWRNGGAHPGDVLVLTKPLDPQTSGGLLAAVAPTAAAVLLRRLPAAAIVGRVVDGTPGAVILRA